MIVAALGLDKDWPMTKVSLVQDQVEYYLVVHYYHDIANERVGALEGGSI